jgi:hypothetical protein
MNGQLIGTKVLFQRRPRGWWRPAVLTADRRHIISDGKRYVAAAYRHKEAGRHSNGISVTSDGDQWCPTWRDLNGRCPVRCPERGDDAPDDDMGYARMLGREAGNE